MRKCVRAAVARAANYKKLAEGYLTVAHQQAIESAAVWALSMGACAGMPRFTVVRTPAACNPGPGAQARLVPCTVWSIAPLT